MFGRRRGRERTAQQVSGQGPADQRGPSVRKPKSKRGTGGRAGDEQSIPSYTPSITARSIDGHLLRTNQDVFAWYRLSPQRWSFRSDAQRQDLIAAIAGQYAELQGRWLHLRVTTRPYPIRMWAEAHVRNARNALQDVPGALSFDDYMVGEQQQLMGRSMAEKEVYLGVQVQTRNVVDRAVERAAPLLRKVFPEAVDAELVALDSEVEHLDQVIGSAGLDGRPVTAEEVSWLMHRSCSLGLPAPRNLPAVPGAPWEPEDLASFTDAADMHQDPYAPTVTVRGRTGSNAGVSRNVAVLTMGQGHGLQIPEVDDPWMQRSDRLSAPVEWSARIYVRRPEDVSGELQRQMNKVRSQVRHYTEEHGLEPPTSLARQASRVLEIDDEMTSGFTALATRVKSWWRMAVSGPTERDALRLAQQLLDLYKPKIAIEHPEAQYAMAREFIPGEPLANGAYLRRGSVVWAGSAVPQATAEVGDRRGVLLGETCTATRRPVAWDPWMAQEVRDASGLTAMVAGLGGGKALALDTPLPTPTGWTTMSEVAVGDHVLGGDGAPTRVVAATDVLFERPCYDVVFSDGSVIRADAQHQWVTQSNTATASRVVDGSPHPVQQPVVRTTSEIAARIASGQQFQHPVPTAASFDLPETDLSVEPYLLGAWLGDAMSRRASIASSDPELIQEIEATGQECTYHPARGEHELPTTVRQNLCHLGLLDNKHVPVDYLRAGEQQRRALLAGLLDAAGGCDPSGRVEFFASGERLARDVRELVLGLGYPAQLHAQRSDRTHSDTSPVHTVSFTTPDKVFRLARKLALLDPSAPVEERRITAVVPVDSVPVRCVEVANAEHTYLAGPACVPTHNSFLGGGTVYKTLRAGAHWTLLDPSGPLAELCELPELKPYARPINLLNAQPGILNPYRVVAEPELEHFVDEEDPERGWRRERALAAATRRRLVLDVLTGLLPYEVARLPQTRIVLLRAVRAVGGRPDAHPGMVFEALRRDASEHHEHAIVVADFLDEIRERMSLLIPESDADPYSEGRDDRLTVLTMAGLTLPKDGVGREHWTDAEALGVQMLNLAAWLTQRTLYERPKNERKGVWIDEAFFLSEVPTGRVLMNRFARDSRKWNVRVLLSSQIPADFLRIQGFAALLDSVFIGRLDDEQAQADALRLLKVPVDAGYEQVVSALGRRPGPARNNTERDRSPRQFIFGDGDGGVEKIRIDFSGDHLEHLRTALDTTPAANEQEERESPPVADGANSDVAGTASVADGTTGGSLVGYVPEAEEYPDDLDSFDELELETVGIGRDGTTAEREGGTGDAHAAQPHENGHADRPTRRTGGEPGWDETW